MDRISTQLYSHPLCGGVVGPLREDLVKAFIRGCAPDSLPPVVEADYLVVQRTPYSFLYERKPATPFRQEGFDKVAEFYGYDPATLLKALDGLKSPFKLLIVPSIGDYTSVKEGSPLDAFLRERIGKVKSFADLPEELPVPQEILPRPVKVLVVVMPDQRYWAFYCLPCAGRLWGVVIASDGPIHAMLKHLLPDKEEEFDYLVWRLPR